MSFESGVCIEMMRIEIKHYVCLMKLLIGIIFLMGISLLFMYIISIYNNIVSFVFVSIMTLLLVVNYIILYTTLRMIRFYNRLFNFL